MIELQKSTDVRAARRIIIGAGLTLTENADGLPEIQASSVVGTIALDDLTDVTAPTPASGDFLKFNGSIWVNSNDLTGATFPASAITSGTLAYARLPTGGGTWANGGALSITGGTTTVAGLNSTGNIIVTGVIATLSSTDALAQFQRDTAGTASFTIRNDSTGGIAFDFAEATTVTSRIKHEISNNRLRFFVNADMTNEVMYLSSAGINTPLQLVSTLATGTAPLAVASTTLVNNLNAELLSGQNSAFYRNASNMNAGTLPYAQLPNGAGTWNTGGAVVITGGQIRLDSLRVDGNVGIGTATVVNDAIGVAAVLSGSGTQTGINMGVTFSSAATTAVTGMLLQLITQAAAYTVSNMYGLRMMNPGKGAGSTITSLYGLYVDSLTAGTNNFAIKTNTGTVELGDLVRLQGDLQMTVTASRLIPGATSFAVRNNANNANNLLLSDAGDATLRGLVTLLAATSRIVPGATSMALRNSANNADNVLVVDAGDVTLRASLGFAAAAAQIIGGVTSLALRNSANSLNNILIMDNGQVTLRNDLVLGSLGAFDAADTAVDGNLLIYKGGGVNKWQAENFQFVQGTSNFKAAILADSTAVAYVLLDPGTGSDTVAGNPPDPATPTITIGHRAFTLQVAGYTKPADFRYFEWQTCIGASCSGFAALANTTSQAIVHSRLTAGEVRRYRVRAVDRAGNVSNWLTTTDQTVVAQSDTQAFASIIAGEIVAVDLTALFGDVGILIAGQARGAANTYGINFGGQGGIPATWTAGINFENTSLNNMTRYLNFDSTASSSMLKHERLEITFDGTVKMYRESAFPMFNLTGTDFYLQNDPGPMYVGANYVGNGQVAGRDKPTQGLLVSGTLPDSWVRYINLNGAGYFIKHEKMSLKYDGTGTFNGTLDITNPDFLNGFGTTLAHIILRNNGVDNDLDGMIGAGIAGTDVTAIFQSVPWIGTTDLSGLNIIGVATSGSLPGPGFGPALLLEGWAAATTGWAVDIRGNKRVSTGLAPMTGSDIVLQVSTGNAGITVLLTVDATGNINYLGDLKPLAAVARLIGGSTSFAVRNHANSADNLLIADSGAATFRTTVQALGILTASANLAVANTLTIPPTTVSLSTSQNNYSVSNITVLLLTLGNSINITGLAGGAAGRVIMIINVDASGPGFTVTLINNSVSSSVGNRFSFASGDVVLSPNGGGVTLIYDATSQFWYKAN